MPEYIIDLLWDDEAAAPYTKERVEKFQPLKIKPKGVIKMRTTTSTAAQPLSGSAAHSNH